LTDPSIEQVLKAHPLTRELRRDHARLLSAHAQNRVFAAGEYLWRQGEEGDALLLIHSGEVDLEISVPNQGPLPVETIVAGEALGCSWMAPSERWQFDARALTPVQAVVLQGRHVREACDQDVALGYELLKRLTPAIAQRLQRARLRLIEQHLPR
jgi:CRP/FNR family cyclic AMP-dependent transcriptional regulator